MAAPIDHTQLKMIMLETMSSISLGIFVSSSPYTAMKLFTFFRKVLTKVISD